MSENSSKSSSCSRPPRPLLSGRDMLQHHVGNYDFHTRIHRLTRSEDEAEHQDHISKIRDDFRRILEQQRVGKAETYSEGEWDNNRKRVSIRRAVGKWHIYGYLEDKIRYLDGYEALHLLEMNRLIVYWDTVVISLQQAYGLFLGYPESLTLEQYQVYSILMRAGYYVLKCDSNRKYQAVDSSLERKLSVEEKCVWQNLYHILRQPHPLVEEVELDLNAAMHNKVRESMQNLNSTITMQQEPRPTDEEHTMAEYNSEKRNRSDSDHDEDHRKRVKTNDSLSKKETDKKSRLDSFIDLFASFDVVKSAIGTTPPVDEDQTTLRLHFDVFPSDGSVFRKSQPVIPEYRIIVRLSNEPLLTAKDIAVLYQRQPKPEVPILLMQVAETLSIHCFLYSFYRLPGNLITTAAACTHQSRVDRSKEEEAVCDSSDDD
ncbi:uncharacterized protein Tsen54 [Ochlerotatus camptorhynchus]|uniref:uncharacterized protein Tsen54 n=1 Tax=Ochlerotatus camptorhynchus TaxID=644619 RepID=UPI0031D83931